ncbi:hypothetical protein [Primorskyibacter sp. S187A]|uniref:hypothetical protein n=1 Tax=Primorskyibacter sp. S187A TaxID=3415130 RepID=UPI003C79D231
MFVVTRKSALISTVSAVALVLSLPAMAQDVVSLPVGENTEPVGDVIASGAGFTISIPGEAVGQAPARVKPRVAARIADRKLASSDIQVTFDGLGAKPRLDALLLNDAAPLAGQVARVQSQLNYPAFVTRGEMRVLDMDATGGPKLLSVQDVAPGQVAAITVPEGNEIVVVHRVYDAQGRFDETVPISLKSRGSAPVADGDGGAVEEGTTRFARRSIPVHGGAVTVRGSNVPGGRTVRTLGEPVTPAPDGSFVLQRILPPGEQAVRVEGPNGGFIERIVTIPRSDWFGTGTVDLTFGKRLGDRRTPSGERLDETYSYGRIAGYAKGRTANGWTLTGSVDTQETDLEDIFSDLDKRDAQDVLLRMAREEAYPTYGDDSTIEDGAPTDGKFYLKAERDGSHLLWGNYKATVTGSHYLRNERQLYGFQGVYQSPQQTSRGQSRVRAEVYAASPERLPGREIFRGTGGSVYFLERQDISVGSETITVELRDRDTGRVIETRTLIEGRDYDVNYIQGIITLRSPLTGSIGGGGVVTEPGGDIDVRLIAQYEFSPVAGDVDGMSTGGRLEAWVTDELRLGVTAMQENTDVADQLAKGVDVRWERSSRTWVELEYAETEGPGFGSSSSPNGGLIITSNGTAGRDGETGEAWRFATQIDLADVGVATPGTISAYWEKRSEDFATLDHATTDDEELWGISTDLELTERLRMRLSYDDYESDSGKVVREGGVELSYAATDRVTYDVGLEHVERKNAGGDKRDGSRTDLALRATVTENENLSWYLFGQGTLQRTGDIRRNDRVGAGVRYRFAENWTFEGELSEGTLGTAGEALLTYQSDGYDSAYVGYRLEPGRDFTGVTLNGRDRGSFVAGGKRRISDNVDMFGENTYDLFGRHTSLTSAYGVDYRATERLTFSTSFEVGRVRDGDDDFDRNAVSVGVSYDDGEALQARARLEYRLDQGDLRGSNRDVESVLFSTNARYQIDDGQRLLFSYEISDTDAANSSLPNGTYVDASVGYALRPVLDDKLNVLFKYRYLYDMVGQEVDGADVRGPRQESHVLSLDADYDLNQQWTLGGKIGGRASNSAPDEDTDLAQNDAWLGVLNARYHVTHKWDLLGEVRHLEAVQAEISETSFLGAAYRHVGNNFKVGVGYNFGTFSDDLTDLTYDDEGAFINLIAKF